MKVNNMAKIKLTKKFVINRERLTESESIQLEQTIISSDFNNVVFSEEFKSNVAKHLQRIGIVNND